MSARARRPDLCVIGAGSGGLSVAAGAALMGADAVLIERAAMGGDCLNTGCVPSKALLAASRAAKMVHRAGRFGVAAPPPTVEFAAVHRHVHGVIAAIAPHDSVERFEGMGVRVIRAAARFVAPDRVVAGDQEITARRFVIATGSRPLVPPIPGLDQVRYLTNETIFDLTEAPRRLIVIGGGPIGCELAQAHRRLGVPMTLLEQAAILPRDDNELVDVLRHRLVEDGVELFEQVQVARVEPAAAAEAGGGVAVVLGDGSRVVGSHLLVATGRRPVTDDLGLEAAGVAVGADGAVVVDRGLRTTNRRVLAVGDATGGPFFTHRAGYHATVVLRRCLLRLPARVDLRALPWVTYTEPELAQVGLTEAEARARHGRVRVLRHAFAANDRAIAERAGDGLIKVVLGADGRVLGASIVGPHAGELLMPWSLAIANRLKVGALAGLIVPYPTLSEVNKRAAFGYYEPMVFGPWMKRLVRGLARLG